MKTHGCLGLLVLIFATAQLFAETLPEARLTIRLVDEDGNSLTGMPVTVGFSEEIRNGYSDASGCFSATGKERLGDLRCGCTAGGYYPSDLPYRYSAVDTNGNSWLPSNPVVTMMVRKVISPVPVYAKRVETRIPTTNQNWGFDLNVADWVRPQGKGIVSDLVFRVDGFWKNYRDNDSVLTLSLAPPNDGLIPISYSPTATPMGSEFFLPRQAPENGYQSPLHWHRLRKAVPGSSNDEVVDDLRRSGSYLFRVRSSANSSGVITNAYYGAIPGCIDFAGAGADKEGSWLRFTYYMNPSNNDRNLEFDLNKNTSKDWTSPEADRAP